MIDENQQRRARIETRAMPLLSGRSYQQCSAYTLSITFNKVTNELSELSKESNEYAVRDGIYIRALILLRTYIPAHLYSRAPHSLFPSIVHASGYCLPGLLRVCIFSVPGQGQNKFDARVDASENSLCMMMASVQRRLRCAIFLLAAGLLVSDYLRPRLLRLRAADWLLLPFQIRPSSIHTPPVSLLTEAGFLPSGAQARRTRTKRVRIAAHWPAQRTSAFATTATTKDGLLNLLNMDSNDIVDAGQFSPASESAILSAADDRCEEK